MTQLENLLQQIRACRICEEHLVLGPRPVLRASTTAKLLIVGQAPGTKVHASGKPWDDQSGKRLRLWLGLEPEVFYDESKVAIVPIGFCYPGKGKSGDLPPRPECARHWHQQLLSLLPNIELTLLVGKYAQDYFLKEKARPTLTQTVANWHEYLPAFMPMPHPSPRNQFWVKHNPWFELDAVPYLQQQVKQLLS
ncbi:uracil-DNA glycosylase family protein [Pontibacter sp. BT310]|uniref:Uracil-DNA glycosylase family protein n=1 Tax=Pontibacter populi TaxID=890055 RepID=A0ABS6XFW9_9BACT|nr:MULTISPECIES: uracil-DNA glycosylase family protein [Pontibacter]MBJ6119923.1 uracil-DNA glycosylase family protein [Pontibacter sp. BT310]MBR0572352.1 uracil-DNA glycosylase family protein [Microvirga sp. STS03]MBW3366776.1 uracil-DNA glycosylase family protein [Pontibacter populi]